VELAVHSAKDLETDLPEGLEIAAVLKREDPRDALVTRGGGNLSSLPAGSRIGVSSLRRQAQLKRLRRDLEVLPIRGNVDTRLKKLDSQEYDALILAAAGLKRLGLSDRVSESLDPARFLPAPGQGTLAVEIRADRAEVAEKVRALDDASSRWELEAERSLLRALGGSCRVPVGGLARVTDGNNLSLEGVVLSPDGLKALRQSVAGPAKAAQRLGKELASHLRAMGADRLLYGKWKT
jgi:hydroxymethylbilane synthase